MDVADGGLHPRGLPLLVGLVAVGGVIGSLARYAISLAFAQIPGGSPLGTLVVNVVGCLAIGALLAALDARASAVHRRSLRWRALLVTGVLGGFTTFSGFAVATVALAETGAWLATAGYLFVTLLAGVLAPPVGRSIVGILRSSR